MKFLDSVARYPGSTHDSFIFSNSILKTKLENGDFGEGILLGDSGYPLKPYLMTPLRNPQIHAEKKYNESHILTRNTVERKYGVWKRRFPCLSMGLRLKSSTQLAVIVACAVLHNFCIDQKEKMPPEIVSVDTSDVAESLEFEEPPSNNYNIARQHRIAKQKQQQLINQFDDFQM